MKNNIEFTTDYQRPVKLSDPYHDFNKQTLKKILKTKDEDFTWWEYQCIFGPHLPAGTYEEITYFLPMAFSYMIDHEDDALDMVTAIFGFCSKNIAELEKDKLAVTVRAAISQCLLHWSRELNIIHFDRNACKDKGWGLDYKDYIAIKQFIN